MSVLEDMVRFLVEYFDIAPGQLRTDLIVGVCIGLAPGAWSFWKKWFSQKHPTPDASAEGSTRKTRSRRRRIWRATRAIVISGGVVIAIVCVVLLLLIAFAQAKLPVPDPSSENSTPDSSSSKPIELTPTPMLAPTANVAPLPVGHGCPTPHDARLENRVDLEVFFWCIGSAVNEAHEWDDTQFQLKVRLGITASPRGSMPVDVRSTNPSTVRVLVPYVQNLRWAPPLKTAEAGDSPQCIYINGVAYWAIPPNINDDAQQTPDGGYNFASHWDPYAWGFEDQSLQPGEFMGDASRADVPSPPDARGRTTADLVFTLPANALDALYGVVLFDTAQSADPSAWTIVGECVQSEGCLTETNQLDPSMF